MSHHVLVTAELSAWHTLESLRERMRACPAQLRWFNRGGKTQSLMLALFPEFES